ncbi:transposase [Nocardia araoensis]|uniref:transposase n=1 Tax=Nocardia araoensis TaxID=228600 RepID=UPI000A0110AD
MRGCGASRIGRSWTSSVARAWSTGRARSATERRCGRKRDLRLGPNPVDRGRTGSKIHALSDRDGLPLSVAVSAANTNYADALKPLVRPIPAIKSRHGPRQRKPDKLHADKAYDHIELRECVHDREMPCKSPAKASSPARSSASTDVGKHRRVIERSIAWLFGYHRLTIRY